MGLAGALATNMVAQEDKTLYVGFGIGTGSGEQTRDWSYPLSGTFTTEYDAKSTSFKFGHIFESKNRFELSYNIIKADATKGTFAMNTTNTKSSTYKGFDFDWLFTFRNQEVLQPYLLVGFGLYNNDDIDGYNANTGKADTARAFSFNYGAGFNYMLGESAELEVAYKGKSLAWNMENPDISDKLGVLYLGVNYKF
jgi:hypothetical protein